MSARRPQMVAIAETVITALAELDDEGQRRAVLAFVEVWLRREPRLRREPVRGNGVAVSVDDETVE